MRLFHLLFFALYFTYNGSSQDPLAVFLGIANSDCASLKGLRPFELDKIAIRSDSVEELKTVKTPIYIEILIPPKDPHETILFWLPSTPSDCSHCKKFEMLPRPFANTNECYIINPNVKRPVYFTVVNWQKNNYKKLKMNSIQLNPNSEESTKWFRIVEVKSLATPGHIIKFLVWKVPNTR